jgi:hypothetical protein
MVVSNETRLSGIEPTFPEAPTLASGLPFVVDRGLPAGVSRSIGYVVITT